MNQKEKTPALKYWIVANRVVFGADILATPILATLYNKIGICYSGMGILLASGWMDMYLTGQLNKHKNKASDPPSDTGLPVK